MNGFRRTITAASMLIALLVTLAACRHTGSAATPTATGGGTSPAPLLNVDCAVAQHLCPAIAVQGDKSASGGFHGYADPSMRKDPNVPTMYMAYSWPRTLADATHVVDLHLAYSTDGGSTWKYAGSLFTSQLFANPGGGAYAATNDTSNEVVDLLPLNQNGTTVWIQAHMAYLVPAGNGTVYAQLAATNYLSISAIAVTNPAADPTALLQLGSAKEARLGNASTDATLHPNINLATLNPALARCVNFNQPTLYAVNGTLYLATQCFESGAGSVDASESSFAVFSTQPNGTDPTRWTWAYAGEMATAAQASKLGKLEGTPYQGFTEMQLTASASGQLLAILSPFIRSSGQQPANQYGCRAIPVTSLATPGLQTDAAGVPVVTAKVTENDLYANPNQGPGACTYEPAANTGIVVVRKLERDPSLGFFVSLQATHLKP